jgi:leader peptidase (prepilin peptidase)/N-methyltransferase
MTTLELALPLVTFVIFATPLSIVDARQHILPNRLVFAGCASVLAMQIIVGFHHHASNLVQQSLTTAGETLAVYLILFVASRGQLGMGDVKFSVMTGLILGWVAPQLWLIAIWVAFAMAAIWALSTRARGRHNLHMAIAFGPFMSISTLLCTLIGLGIH